MYFSSFALNNSHFIIQFTVNFTIYFSFICIIAGEVFVVRARIGGV